MDRNNIIPKSSSKSKIFISYSREDIEFVNRLETALNNDNFELLIDRSHIEKLTDWWERIQQLISQADSFIFVISPNSINSSVCRDEIKYAALCNKRLAPIVYKPVEQSLVPEELARLNYILFDAKDKFDTALQDLIFALEVDIDWVREHTRIGEISRRWEGRGRTSGLLLRGKELKEAEGWLEQEPKGAPQPTLLHKQYITESRRTASRRGRYWLFGIIITLAIMAQIGVIAYFFHQDSQINEARFFLQNSQLETAELKLKELWGNSLARLIPDTASAKEIASQFLDTAIVQTLFKSDHEQKVARPYDSWGEMILTKSAIYALKRSENSEAKISHLLIRCDLLGNFCVQLKFDLDWRYPILVHDEDKVILLSRDAEHENEIVQLSEIPSEGEIKLHLMHTKLSSIPQIKKLSDKVIWVTKGYARDLYLVTSSEKLSEESVVKNSDLSVFSESPPLLGSNNSSIKNYPIVTNPDVSYTDANSITNPVYCSLALNTCIARIMNFEEDARGTIEDFALGHINIIGSNINKRIWEFDIPTLFESRVEKTSIAVAADGASFAISSGNLVKIWNTADVSKINYQPSMSIQLLDTPLAMSFDSQTGNLIVLTHLGNIKIIYLNPRGQWIHREPPSANPTRPMQQNNNDVPQEVISELDWPALITKDQKGNVITGEDATGTEKDNQPEIINWGNSGIITIYKSSINTTLLRSRPSALSVIDNIPGEVISISENGKFAISQVEGCLFGIFSTDKIGNNSKLIEKSLFPSGADCYSYSELFEILWNEEKGVILAIHFKMPDKSKTSKDIHGIRFFNVNLSADKNIDIQTLGNVYYFNILLTIESPSRISYLTEEGEIIVVDKESKIKHQKLNTLDKELLRFIQESEQSDKLELLEVGKGKYLAFLDNASCPTITTEQYEEEPERGGRLLLIADVNGEMELQYLLDCITDFPSKSYGHNADVGVRESDDNSPVFFGAYTFNGMFAWTPEQYKLDLFLFNKPSSQSVGSAKQVLQLSGKSSAFKKIDLSKLSHYPDGRGSTHIKYSPNSKKIVFFASGESSGSTDHQVKVFDLKSMKLLDAPNKSLNFFDQLDDVELSPTGNLFLSHKEDTGYELFTTKDVRKIALPPNIDSAEFKKEAGLELTLKNGDILKWDVPEDQEGEVDYLRKFLLFQEFLKSPPSAYVYRANH